MITDIVEEYSLTQNEVVVGQASNRFNKIRNYTDLGMENKRAVKRAISLKKPRRTIRRTIPMPLGGATTQEMHAVVRPSSLRLSADHPIVVANR